MSLTKILTSVLKSLAEALSAWRLYRLAGAAASLLASMRIAGRSSVTWDGDDWIYKWGKTGAVHSSPTYNPKNNMTNVALFFHAYVPADGDTIVDVGVENGEEIPAFCAQAGKNGRVLAIEADPACCRRLRKLKALLRLENLVIIEAAVGESSGQMFFTQDLGSLANRVVEPGEHHGEVIEVDVRPLEELLLPHNVHKVDYLKVNIEGSETALLKGLTRRIVIRNFCISCHDFIGPQSRTYAFVQDWLKEHGYTVKPFEPQDVRKPWRNYYLYGEVSA